MNVKAVADEILKLSALRYRVGDEVQLIENIEDVRGRDLAKKGDKVKILKVYSEEERRSGDDYEVMSLSNKKIFDIPYYSLRR